MSGLEILIIVAIFIAVFWPSKSEGKRKFLLFRIGSRLRRRRVPEPVVPVRKKTSDEPPLRAAKPPAVRIGKSRRAYAPHRHAPAPGR